MDANTQFQPLTASAFFTTAVTSPLYVTETQHFFKAVEMVRLTLVNAPITITEALDYANFKLADLPPTNLIFLATEANLTLVKGNTTNGMVAATDYAVAIGTAVASNVALTSTMANVLASQSITADLVTNTLQVHNLATTPAPVGVLDGAPTAALYLNVGVAAGITATDTLTVSGNIDFYVIDVGNATS